MVDFYVRPFRDLSQKKFCGLFKLKWTYKKDGDRFFNRACSDKTRGDGFTLKEGIFRLDMRKKFCTMRVVKHWHRLPHPWKHSRPGETRL